MQPRFRNLQIKMFTYETIELFDEKLPPIGIQFSHPFDVTEKKSLGQKTGECRLIDGGRMLIHYRPDLNHRVDQWFWGENVTEPQRWIENLTHGSGVDDATGVIESLQTRERGTGKTKLRIVVVFENEGVPLAGE